MDNVPLQNTIDIIIYRYLADYDLTPVATGSSLDFIGPPDAYQPPGLYKSSRAIGVE